MNNKVKAPSIVLLMLFLASCIAVNRPVLATTLQQDSWLELAPMHQERLDLGVIAVDGKIYAIGGTTSFASAATSSSIVGTNEQFDPASNRWVYKTPMPTARAYFAIASYQGKIYCFGGETGERLVDEESGFYSYVTSNVTEVYDTVTDTWTTKAPMPISAMMVSAHQINGKIYVLDYSKVLVYDPVSDTWAKGHSVPSLKTYYGLSPPNSAVLDNKLVLTQVHDIGSPSTGPIPPAEQIAIYDPTNNQLTQGKDGEIGVGPASLGVTVGNMAPPRVYVLGVLAQKSPNVPVNQAYDPVTDSWLSAAAMPSVRTDFGVAVVDDTLFAIGGLLKSYSYDSTGKYVQSCYATPTNINERYTPLGYGTLHPKVEILSPHFGIYNSTSVSLEVNVNRPSSELCYSLDGKENVTMTANFTITHLINGEHNLTVYARDFYGNVGNQTVTFTIEKPMTEVFSNACTYVALIITVAVVCLTVALLTVYGRRRKSG